MKEDTKPISRKENIVIQEVDKDIFIYDLKTNKVLCLNEISAFVWNICDGKNSINQLRKRLSEKLGEPIEDELIWLALDQLSKNNLIETKVKPDFRGMTRREVAKKIGLTSMITLPTVFSIVAPNSIHAQSCVAPGNPVGNPVPLAISCITFDSLCCNNNTIPGPQINGEFTCLCQLNTPCLDCNAPNSRMPGCSCAVDLGGGLIVGDNSLCCTMNCLSPNPQDPTNRICG